VLLANVGETPAWPGARTLALTPIRSVPLSLSTFLPFCLSAFPFRRSAFCPFCPSAFLPSCLSSCLSAVLLLTLGAGCGRGPLVDAQQVPAVFTTQALPAEDPDAAIWRSVPEHRATLIVQDVTEPKLSRPGVTLVRVKAIHDGRSIVFRLAWTDTTKDVIPETGRSSDAVAVQFAVLPGTDLPDAAMGETGKPVEICYWKAVWQDDHERARNGGADRVATLYPSMAVDHYPASANPSAQVEMERRYAPAAAAANPVTVPPQAGAVQELLAEGFGTSMVPADQKATGRGVWARDTWTVTVARPLEGGPGRSNLALGRRSYLALAVWDGADRQTGSRKMRSGWVPLFVEAVRP